MHPKTKIKKPEVIGSCKRFSFPNIQYTNRKIQVGARAIIANRAWIMDPTTTSGACNFIRPPLVDFWRKL